MFTHAVTFYCHHSNCIEKLASCLIIIENMYKCYRAINWLIVIQSDFAIIKELHSLKINSRTILLNVQKCTNKFYFQWNKLRCKIRMVRVQKNSDKHTQDAAVRWRPSYSRVSSYRLLHSAHTTLPSSMQKKNPPHIIIAVVHMFIFFLSPVLWLPL